MHTKLPNGNRNEKLIINKNNDQWQLLKLTHYQIRLKSQLRI